MPNHGKDQNNYHSDSGALYVMFNAEIGTAVLFDSKGEDNNLEARISTESSEIYANTTGKCHHAT